MRQLVTGIVTVIMAMGINAQEGEAQEEPKIKLELIWEKEIPEGVKDFVFLDEEGYNVFSSQCRDPEKALREKRVLMVQDGRLRFYEGDEMRLTKEVSIRGGHITISKNGRNIATIEGLERDPSGKGGYADRPAILRLYNWRGEELARTSFSPKKGLEYVLLYPLGNDRTVALGLSGSEGLYHGIKVFVEEDRVLREVFSDDETSWVVDYAESGERLLVVLKNKYMVLFDGSGREDSRYICPRAYRKGFLSPQGNYIAEVTAGKYVMIFDRQGGLIAEHHVQGRGNYYAAFSPDERYLCVTPGPWRIYFFETETGKMLWEYVDTDEESHFSSIAVTPEKLVFAGHSEAILKPGEFKGTIEQLNKKVIENETKNRSVYVLESGRLLKKLDRFPGAGFGTQLQSPNLKLSADGRFLLINTPTKNFIYRVHAGGER